MSFCQFDGAPCLRHNNYAFYKSFKYRVNGWSKTLALGDFFFLKLLKHMPVCISEIELLWEDTATNQLLASIKLYFQPEHTPNGRQDFTGEDEVIALGDRVVLRLDDLIPLIQHNVNWTYGCPSDHTGSPRSQEKNADASDAFYTHIQECGREHGSGTNGIIAREGYDRKLNLDYDTTKMDCTEMTHGSVNVAVLSYPRYCRYRAIRKRLEGCENEWLHLALVVAIGGYTGLAPGCQIMFCRNTFYQPEFDDIIIGMSHMLPELKAEPKGKKNRQLCRTDSLQDSDSMEEMFVNVTPSVSTSSRPRRSTESSETGEEKVSTEEQAFLIGLHKFMHDAKMPIGRIPSLGFKQIDLYFFYKQAEKLGGYDSITHKRMWKHLYDKLGGNSSNTSAATCTRRHYERLLLPYERHLHRLKLGRTQQKQRDRKTEIKAEIQQVFPMTTVQEVEKDKLHKCNQSDSEAVDCGDVNVKSESPVNHATQSSVNHDTESPVNHDTESPVTHEVLVLSEDAKMSRKLVSRESCCNEQKGSTNCMRTEMPVVNEFYDSHMDKLKEHSKPHLEIGSQVMELHFGRHSSDSKSTMAAAVTVDKDGGSCQELPVSQCQHQHEYQQQREHQQHHEQQQCEHQQQVVKSSAGLPPSLPSGTLIVGENSLPTNVIYRGGYLHPVLSPQILQSPWGVMVQPSPSPSTSCTWIRTDEVVSQSASTSCPQIRTDEVVSHSTSTSRPQIRPDEVVSQSASTSCPQIRPDEVVSQSASTSRPQIRPDEVVSQSASTSGPQIRTDEVVSQSASRDAANASLSAKISQDLPCQDIHLKSAIRKLSLSSQNYQLIAASGSDVQKPSHFSLGDHMESSAGKLDIAHLSRGELTAKSSHSLAALLHPTDAGHKHLPHLPPAPSAVYLHPSSSSLHSPVTVSSPPPAHSHPHKRGYPFDSPSAPAVGMFPSPDMVLDRIRNSTTLPCNSTVIANSRFAPQRFEDPRQIFAQTSQFVAATHNVSQLQKKEPHFQPELVAIKLSREKSKNSRKCHQAYTSSKHMASPELQQALLQQGHVGHRPANNSKIVKKKSTCHFNGMMSSHQSNKSMNPVMPASTVPSANQDGRLTSALFGTQFTALPRTSKSCELTAVQTLMSDPSQAAVVAASLNPHLHPAFISPYLPAGSTSGTSVMNSQLQMLASTFSTPGQLAAYDQMFTQNSYGAFLSAATQGKLSKKTS